MDGSLLIAEDLLLLLLDDNTGALLADGTSADYALAGAVLMELALGERIRVAADPRGRRRRRPPVEVVGPRTGDGLLDAALDVVAVKPRRAQDLVPKVADGLRGKVLARLSDRGLVVCTESRFGPFHRRRWPASGADGYEVDLRDQLRRVLLPGLMPDPRTAALIAVLSAAGAAHKVLGELDRATAKQVRRNAEEIAKGDWSAAAVRDAIAAVQAAVVAATAATAAAVVASS